MHADVIESLANELRKGHSFHTLQNRIGHILMKKGIIDKKGRMECKYINKDSPECTFGCKVAAEHNQLSRKKLEIIVKPDHLQDEKGHRTLRVIIIIGEGKDIKIFQKTEDEDRPGRNAKKVLRKEIRDAIRDVRHVLDKAA